MEAIENGLKASAEKHHRKAFGLAAKDDSGVLSPFTFSRRFGVTSLMSPFTDMSSKKSPVDCDREHQAYSKVVEGSPRAGFRN